jgi:hypothetical protein
LDYRRPLFQLEQWSPFLAKKIWGLTTLLESPMSLALGFRVHHLTDLNSEVILSGNRLNQETAGVLKAAVILAAAEFASKVLWARHLDPQFDQLQLASIHGRFLKPAIAPLTLRTEMKEVDRERLFRKLRLGEPVEFEMPIIVLDSQDQQVASVSCIWNLKTLRPAVLSEGRAL